MANIMVKKYPADNLYRHILAEAYAKNEEWPKAIELFYYVVSTDELNQRLGSDSEISHRVFCSDCFLPIRGIRQKCQSTTCVDYDHCTDCLNGRGESSESCLRLQHPLVSIPSRSLSAIWAYPQVLGPPPVQVSNSSLASGAPNHLSPTPAKIPAPPGQVNPTSASATARESVMLPGLRRIGSGRRT